ncbi:MAG: site-2 protease family protein [Chloroflexi bacterium]|nr:site-2 protease family protein [Chloroflexota bacterium]
MPDDESVAEEQSVNESESDPGFEFKIGASAWFGMAFTYVYILNLDAHLLLDSPSSEDQYLLPLIGVGMLFGSILLHEIGHAIAFTVAGFKVRTIALEVWGGYTAAETGISQWRLPLGKYFWTSFAGPGVNLLIAVVVWTFILESPDWTEARDLMMLSGTIGQFYWAWLLAINLYLAVLNLLPLYPMDGGHVFRAILMFFIGGFFLPTLISGAISITVGGLGAIYVVLEIREGGWARLEDLWVVGLFSFAVIWGSLGALLTLADPDEPAIEEG